MCGQGTWAVGLSQVWESWADAVKGRGQWRDLWWECRRVESGLDEEGGGSSGWSSGRRAGM